MKSNLTKKAKLREDILKFLFVCGRVRSSDVRRFLSYKYENPQMGSRLCTQFIHEGLLMEIPYDLSVKTRNGRKQIKDNVIALTKMGEDYVSENYPGLQPENEYKKEKQENPIESDALYKKLTDRGIMLMFFAAGVPVLPCDKPSLDHLKASYLNRDAKIEGYMDDLTESECRAFLNNQLCDDGETILCGGAYYTNKEFLEYIKRNETIADSFNGTRIRGIFISNKNCFLVYAPQRFSNRMISVTYKSETSLLVALKKTLIFTDVYRPIPALSSNSYTRYNAPAALVLSDGKRLMYEMATGDIKGQGKEDRDMMKNVESIEKYNAMHVASPPPKPEEDKEDKEDRATTYLTAGSSLFDDIYVTPLSINGLNAMNYLLTNSKEAMIAEAKSVIESIPDFYESEEDIGLFPYRNKKYPSNHAAPEYIPVVNVKQLRHIRERGGEPFIITDSDLLDPIAHSVKLPAHYYDPYSGKEYENDAVFNYTKTGRIEGLEVLKEELIHRGISLNKSYDWSTIHKKLGMEQTEMYNKLARGELSVERVIEVAALKPYQESKKVSRKKKVLGTTVSGELATYVETVLENNDITASTYLRKLIAKDREQSQQEKAE